MAEPQTQNKSRQVASRDPFTSLSERLDRMFGDMSFPFGRGLVAGPRLASLATQFDFREPRVNIAEVENAYEITAELPGMDDKDIDVTVANGVLTLKGEKREEHEEKDEAKNYHLVERSYGSFQRSFGVPDDVEQDKIDAHFEKGVLTIVLPKSKPRDPGANQKKININTR